VRKQHATSKQCSDGEADDKTQLSASVYISKIHQEALDAYNALVAMGVAREQARGILPQSLMTKFYMTGNLRNWAHFVSLRIANDAQPEGQIIARECLDLMRERFPHATNALFVQGESK
jgi:thymidylate synthase (FAD)